MIFPVPPAGLASGLRCRKAPIGYASGSRTDVWSRNGKSAVVTTPAEQLDRVALHPAIVRVRLASVGSLPYFSAGVGSRITLFQACATFTCVTVHLVTRHYGRLARGIARRSFASKASAASSPPRLHRLLPARPRVAGRVSNPTQDTRLFSRCTEKCGLTQLKVRQTIRVRRRISLAELPQHPAGYQRN